jgi:hypothetical protein
MAKEETVEKRKPFVDAPLRLPGQSLDEEIQKILDEDIGRYIVVGLFALVLAGMEWWRYISGVPPSPRAMTIFGVAVALFSAWKIQKHRKRLRDLRLGRDGERIVAESLEDLRKGDHRVFHDILGEGFNIDHVVIGPKGVFTVETKTRSKPAHGKAEVFYDGRQIRVGDGPPDESAVEQTKAQAHWLREILRQSTGKTYPVRPVILLPGWYVNQQVKDPSVLVLNPKMLAAFIDKTATSLPPEDMHLAAFHLARYIRSRPGYSLK